jgi:putative DNA primase/helicase
LGIDDVELLNLASRGASNGAKFDLLFSGIWDGYTSRSEADLALCSMLAFWTGKDHGRMDRLYRQSGLMREKWDTRRGTQTYGDITVEKVSPAAPKPTARARERGAAPRRAARPPRAG